MMTGNQVLVIEFTTDILGNYPAQVLDPIKADQLAIQVDAWVNDNIALIAEVVIPFSAELKASIANTQWRCIGRDSFAHEPIEGNCGVRFVLIPAARAQLHPTLRWLAPEQLIVGSHKIAWYQEEHNPRSGYLYLHLEGRQQPDQTAILQWCHSMPLGGSDYLLLDVMNCDPIGKGEDDVWGITVSVEDRKWSLDDNRTVIVEDIQRLNNRHHPNTITHQVRFSSPIAKEQWEGYLEHRARHFGYPPQGYGDLPDHCGQVGDDAALWQYTCWDSCD